MKKITFSTTTETAGRIEAACRLYFGSTQAAAVAIVGTWTNQVLAAAGDGMAAIDAAKLKDGSRNHEN